MCWNPLPTAGALAVTVLLAACSSGSAPTEAAKTPTGAAASSPASAPSAPARPERVRSADKAFDSYAQPGFDRIAWLGQVCAAAKTPVDYEALAHRFDDAYAAAQDAFAQRDALAAFKTRLDAAITAAKANPYVVMTRFVATIPTYDLKAERYDLSLAVGTNVQVSVADSAVAVRFVENGLDAYHPADEAEARGEEQLLSHGPMPRQVRITAWVKVVGGTFEGVLPVLTVAPVRVSAATYDFQGPGKPVFTATAP